MTLHIRHASASGRLDEAWAYVASDRRLEVLTHRGSMPIAIAILVCSQRAPALGAHPIVRVDSESWRVLPERYVRIWLMGIEKLRPIPCPIGDELAPGEHLLLGQAPPEVSAEIEKL